MEYVSSRISYFTVEGPKKTSLLSYGKAPISFGLLRSFLTRLDIVCPSTQGP
jgi:hypothetical protein